MRPLKDKIRDTHCRDCKLWKGVENVCLIGEGAYPCEIAFIGENPSKQGDMLGKPMVGKAAKKILNLVLDKINLDREEIYITNAVHCRTPQDRTPTNEEIKACRKWLMKELSYVKPKKIIVMGATAARSILDRYNLAIKSIVGKKRKVEMPWGEVEIQFTYHPGFIQRKPYMQQYFKEHIERFISDRDRSDTFIMPFSTEAFLPDFNREVVVDIETLEEKISSIAITSKKGCGYWAEEKKYLSLVKFMNKSNRIIGHNLKFDIKKMIVEGLLSQDILYEDKLFDTLLGWNIIDENCFDKSLKYLSYNYTSMVEYHRPEDDEWDKMDIVRPYNCRDVDATKRLYNIEKKLMNEQPELWIPFKVDNRILNIIIKIELDGLKVDRKELEGMDKDLTKKLKRIKRIVGVENINSGPQKIARLKELGCMLPKTKKGTPRTDKKTLEGLLIGEDDDETLEVIQGLIDYSKYNKLHSSFIKGIGSELDENDLFHPIYFIAKREEGGDEEEGGTVTGRLSAKRFQQIPRDKETLEPELNPRRLFTARNDDYVLLSADFNQMEMAVAGVYYNEKRLIGMYAAGKDMHTQIASDVFGVKEPSRDQRKAAKTVNFGIIYGISEYGLGIRLNWSEVKSKRFIRKYFDKLPDLERGIERLKIKLKKRGYVETYFHRRRRLPGADVEDYIGREMIRQGINSVVQGSAADITKICMWELFQRLNQAGGDFKYGRLIGNLHDEIILEVKRKKLEEVIEWVKEVMARPPFKEYGLDDFPMALRGDMKIGPNWFKAEKKIEF